MGIALADAAADYGAEVDLVLGPVNVLPANNTIKCYKCYYCRINGCRMHFKISGIAILQFCQPQLLILHLKRLRDSKIKKDDNGLVLKLKTNN